MWKRCDTNATLLLDTIFMWGGKTNRITWSGSLYVPFGIELCKWLKNGSRSLRYEETKLTHENYSATKWRSQNLILNVCLWPFAMVVTSNWLDALLERFPASLWWSTSVSSHFLSLLDFFSCVTVIKFFLFCFLSNWWH